MLKVFTYQGSGVFREPPRKTIHAEVCESSAVYCHQNNLIISSCRAGRVDAIANNEMRSPEVTSAIVEVKGT